jgi:hypothetical protein
MDTYGRRSLLLTTLPFLGMGQFMMGAAVGYTNTDAGHLLPAESGDPAAGLNNGLAVAGMYLFCVFYSVGLGPVPFVSATFDHVMTEKSHD